MSPVIQDRLVELTKLHLDKGAHQGGFEEGHCAMELVSWLAGEPFSDAPQCASPCISRFLVRLNDALDDEDRQKLKPLLPKVIGTRGTREQEQARLWMAVDYAARVAAPAAFDVIGQKAWGDLLRSLPNVVDAATCGQAESFASFAKAAAAAAADAAAAYDAAAGYAAAAYAAADAAVAAYVAAAYDAYAADAATVAAAYADAAAAYDAAYAAADAAAVAAAYAAAAGYAARVKARKRMWKRLLPPALQLIERMCSV